MIRGLSNRVPFFDPTFDLFLPFHVISAKEEKKLTWKIFSDFLSLFLSSFTYDSIRFFISANSSSLTKDQVESVLRHSSDKGLQDFLEKIVEKI